MNDDALRAQIQRAKTLCLTERAEAERLLWALATELEWRLGDAPAPRPDPAEVTDYAPTWEAPRPLIPDWSAA